MTSKEGGEISKSPRRSRRRNPDGVANPGVSGTVRKSTRRSSRVNLSNPETKMPQKPPAKPSRRKSKDTGSAEGFSPVIQDPPMESLMTPEPSEDPGSENSDMSVRSQKLAQQMKPLKVNVERVSHDSCASFASPKQKQKKVT